MSSRDLEGIVGESRFDDCRGPPAHHEGEDWGPGVLQQKQPLFRCKSTGLLMINLTRGLVRLGKDGLPIRKACHDHSTNGHYHEAYLQDGISWRH